MHAFPSYALRRHMRVKRLALWGCGNIGPGWIGGLVEFSVESLRMVFPGTTCVPVWVGDRCEFDGWGFCPVALRLDWELLLRLVSDGGEFLSFGVGRWLRPLLSFELDWVFGEVRFFWLSRLLLVSG